MGMSNHEFEIRNYNLVTESNQVKPNYDLDSKEVSIVLFLSPEETVCIIGKVDNNIIVFGDLSKIDRDNKIRDFIKSRKLNLIDFKGLNVIDYGGIVEL